jgi:glycosyltransferase involved in cell wall biosynthesis
MNNRKVCHISTVHRLYDTRIYYKECKSLHAAGYKVHLIITHDRDEQIAGIDIKGLRKPKNRFNRIFINTLVAFIYAYKLRADIYHFHDPELIPIGLLLKLFGSKVVYDVHEDVSKQILYKEWLGSMILKKFTSKGVYLFEQIAVRILDGTISATPDIGKKFHRKKSIVVRNLPILSIIDNAKPHIIEKVKTVLIYAGGLTKIRGIKEIIQAMEYVGDNAELWLFGEWENKEFKRECGEIEEGWRHTKFFGFKKPEEVYSYMKRADIGIINFLPLPNHVNAMPNKPFEYMACSLPMVMSDFPKWKIMFKDCSLFVNPVEPKEIADRLVTLLHNRKLCVQFGKKGRSLVNETYSWEKESKRLFKFYDTLCKG